MQKRSAIKNDLFTDQYHLQAIDKLVNPLVKIETCIDFAHLAAEIDRVAPRAVCKKGGRPPFPTENMARILVLKRIYNLSDEQDGVSAFGQNELQALLLAGPCY